MGLQIHSLFAGQGEVDEVDALDALDGVYLSLPHD